VRRARLYLDAGADCVYPIGLADERQIGLLVEELDAPVNIWWRPGGVPIERLAALGVARISLGSGLYRAAESAARAFLADLAPRATLPAGP
jgi:2-methylisocitrate lyase-like PEP mutase family enzyme